MLRRLKFILGKIRYYSYNYLVNGQVIFPSVAIEINTACNRKCSYCPNNNHDRGQIKNQKFMCWEMFIKIIDDLIKLKYIGMVYFHFYSEPLLDERLVSFIRYTRALLPNANIQIYSNGDLLTEEKYNNLINAGITLINITKHEVPITNKFLTKNKTLPKLRFISIGKYYNRAGLVDVQHQYIPKSCNMVNIVNITTKGDVIFCCQDYHSEYVMGNIKKENLLDIWNKDDYVNLRREVFEGRFNHPLCRKCIGVR